MGSSKELCKIGPVRKCITALYNMIFCAHTDNYILLVVHRHCRIEKNLILELDDKADDKLLLNEQKTKPLRKEQENKEIKKNLLPRGILCLILLYVALGFKIFLVICSLE